MKDEFDKDGMDVFKNAKLANNIYEMKTNISAYVDMIKALAKLRKTKYDACIDEGFTTEQAMYICTTT